MNEMIVTSIFFGIFRWVHLASVVVAVGGTFVLRYVVMPVLIEDDAERQLAFHGRARRKLALIVPTAIGFLILSGIINIVYAFIRPPMPSVTYMIILTIKLLGAFALFAFALMLVLPSSPPNAFQQKRKFWLTMNCHIGFLLIAISVALNFLSGK